ncbi:hypothetical protein CAPTEDRAFT_227572 [Capitella teleta]|uniref:Uncharacterized protein n=1 Tax=Capitella teleta TaxID=283909 RepID=R7THU4_CAPTE|nr:hypothetical protein CAPTEDRAFT_227572 [Capitella teleta]|eukprot:ELT93373.1 hypothetical protein CAPTEDRAFT_227572 [Capitella teleta]
MVVIKAVSFFAVLLAFTGSAGSQQCVWTKFEGKAIVGINDKFINNLDAKQCQDACKREETFKCRSIEIQKSRNNCFLSSANREHSLLVSDPDWDYYENSCSYEDQTIPHKDCPSVGPVFDFGVKSENVMKSYTVNSRDLCERACRKETEFVCKSYQTVIRGRCDLMSKNREEIMLVKIANAQYYELSCDGDIIRVDISITEGADCPRNIMYIDRMLVITTTFINALELNERIDMLQHPRHLTLIISYLNGCVGTWKSAYLDLSIGGNTMTTLHDKSVEECKTACEKEDRFTCRSFEYKPDGRYCSLQTVTSEDLGLIELQGYEYYERTGCFDEDPVTKFQPCDHGIWLGPVKDVGMLGYEERVLENTTSLGCKLECKNTTEFNCRSVMYIESEAKCILQDVTSEKVPLSGLDGYDYFELSGCDDNDQEDLRGNRPLQCKCSGYSHCLSFDSRPFTFMGTCKYTFARDKCQGGVPSGDPTWDVIVNRDRIFESHEGISVLRDIAINLYDHELKINIFQEGRILVNGDMLLGTPQVYRESVHLSWTATTVTLAVQGSIMLTLDKESSGLTIDVPEDLRETMCGLCGDADGSILNDRTVGPSKICMAVFSDAEIGSQASSVDEFGSSWTSALELDDPSCQAICENLPKETNCTEENQKMAKQYCADLTDLNGPFADCVNALGERKTAYIYDICIFDSCHVEDFQSSPCEQGAFMAEFCQRNYNITVRWREKTGCDMECGEGMEYRTCSSICLPTCSDPFATGCGDIEGCAEGCFCKPGLVFNGRDACHNSDHCGCYIPEQRVFVPVGTTYINEDCDRSCSCQTEGGDTICEEMQCRDNEECDSVQGLMQCVCPYPYVYEDDSCVASTNPCKSDTLLQCITCEGNDKESCLTRARHLTCTEYDPICSSEEIRDNRGQTIYYKAECKARDTCNKNSFGPNGQYCTQEAGHERCFNCDYGTELIHQCASNSSATCHLPKDQGTGSFNLSRYFYKPTVGRCVRFIYKGKGGNRNNYEDKMECEKECNIRAPALCFQNLARGNCNSETVRYYYNFEAEKCKSFVYTGCDGNTNNFASKAECNAVCKKTYFPDEE